MSLDIAIRGSLFANDSLCESVVDAPDDAALDDLEAALRAIFDPFPIVGTFRRSIVAP